MLIQKIIEYYYYSKRLSESKDEIKKDNNGIKLIKEFKKICIIHMEKNITKKIIKLI